MIFWCLAASTSCLPRNRILWQAQYKDHNVQWLWLLYHSYISFLVHSFQVWVILLSFFPSNLMVAPELVISDWLISYSQTRLGISKDVFSEICCLISVTFILLGRWTSTGFVAKVLASLHPKITPFRTHTHIIYSYNIDIHRYIYMYIWAGTPTPPLPPSQMVPPSPLWQGRGVFSAASQAICIDN